jgi:uncharacterized protein YndB with AHSA1/START domain
VARGPIDPSVSRNSIVMPVSPDRVFDVLDDAYAYPRWVVGTRRIRFVDADWPPVGSRFHHVIGGAGAEIDDWWRVLRRDRPRDLQLEVRFRPMGVAHVDITIERSGDGSHVTLEETPREGPVARLPRVVVEPMLKVRNAVALHRLRREVLRQGLRWSLSSVRG